MKTIRLGIATVCWLALVGQGCGSGNGNKPRHDLGYSTGNYKHANKADSAQKWQGKGGVPVKRPTAGGKNLSTYKRQIPNQAPVGGITVAHTMLKTDSAGRNYKMQRPSQSTSSVGSGLAGKKKHPGKGAMVGN